MIKNKSILCLQETYDKIKKIKPVLEKRLGTPLRLAQTLNIVVQRGFDALMHESKPKTKQ